MESQEIRSEKYLVEYDSESVTVNFSGKLALGGPKEYKPIQELLQNIVNENPSTITLNLKALEFLNSAGISTLSKFVLGLRKKKNIELSILGSVQQPWQEKSLKNLLKFLPGLNLEIE